MAIVVIGRASSLVSGLACNASLPHNFPYEFDLRNRVWALGGLYNIPWSDGVGERLAAPDAMPIKGAC